MSGIDEQEYDIPQCGCYVNHAYWLLSDIGYIDNNENTKNYGFKSHVMIFDYQLEPGNTNLDSLIDEMEFVICPYCEQRGTIQTLKKIKKLAKRFISIEGIRIG